MAVLPATLPFLLGPVDVEASGYVTILRDSRTVLVAADPRLLIIKATGRNA